MISQNKGDTLAKKLSLKMENANVIKIIVFLQILTNKDIFQYDYLIFIIGRLFLNVKNILQNSSGQKCVLEKN